MIGSSWTKKQKTATKKPTKYGSDKRKHNERLEEMIEESKEKKYLGLTLLSHSISLIIKRHTNSAHP